MFHFSFTVITYFFHIFFFSLLFFFFLPFFPFFPFFFFLFCRPPQSAARGESPPLPPLGTPLGIPTTLHLYKKLSLAKQSALRNSARLEIARSGRICQPRTLPPRIHFYALAIVFLKQRNLSNLRWTYKSNLIFTPWYYKVKQYN